MILELVLKAQENSGDWGSDIAQQLNHYKEEEEPTQKRKAVNLCNKVTSHKTWGRNIVLPMINTSSGKF